jgi:hypothetical protein
VAQLQVLYNSKSAIYLAGQSSELWLTHRKASSDRQDRPKRSFEGKGQRSLQLCRGPETLWSSQMAITAVRHRSLPRVKVEHGYARNDLHLTAWLEAGLARPICCVSSCFCDLAHSVRVPSPARSWTRTQLQEIRHWYARRPSGESRPLNVLGGHRSDQPVQISCWSQSAAILPHLHPNLLTSSSRNMV